MSLGCRTWGYPKISDALVPNLEGWTGEGWLSLDWGCGVSLETLPL